MQVNKDKNVIIIGYGSIGQRHFSILKSEFCVNRIDIVSKHSIENSSGHRYESIENINEWNIYDYIIIASETHKHYEQLLYVQQNVKSKTILVEKPIFCPDYTMQKLNNNAVFVAYNLRFHKIIQSLKELISKENPIFVNVISAQYMPNWRPGRDYRTTYSASLEKGGGVLLDLSHEVDYIQWLFGRIDIQEIKSYNSKMSGLEIKSDDFVYLIGKTEKGIMFNLSMDYLSKIPIRTITIQTDNKTIIADLVKNTIVMRDLINPPDTMEFTDIGRNDTYIEMHKNILSNDTANLCNFDDGISVLDVVSEIRNENKHLLMNI